MAVAHRTKAVAVRLVEMEVQEVVVVCLQVAVLVIKAHFLPQKAQMEALAALVLVQAIKQAAVVAVRHRLAMQL